MSDILGSIMREQKAKSDARFENVAGVGRPVVEPGPIRAHHDGFTNMGRAISQSILLHGKIAALHMQLYGQGPDIDPKPQPQQAGLLGSLSLAMSSLEERLTECEILIDRILNDLPSNG